MFKNGNVGFALLAVAVIGLTGCGAVEQAIEDRLDDEVDFPTDEGSDDNGAADMETVLSSGLIDVILPAGEARNSLPSRSVEIIEQFEQANALMRTVDMPTGSATYSGSSGFAVTGSSGEGFLTALTGDARLVVDFDAASVSGTFDNLAATDVTGSGTITVNSGSIRIPSASISNGGFTGGVTGDLNATYSAGALSVTEDFDVTGTASGGFGGDGAGTAVGSISGSITTGGESNEIEGVFVTTRD